MYFYIRGQVYQGRRVCSGVALFKPSLSVVDHTRLKSENSVQAMFVPF